MSRNTIWVLQNNAMKEKRKKEKKEPLLGSRRGGERRKSCSLSIMSGVAIIDWFGWFNWWTDRSGLCFISLIEKFWGTKTRVITIIEKAECFFTFLLSFLAAVVLLKWKQSGTQKHRERGICEFVFAMRFDCYLRLVRSQIYQPYLSALISLPRIKTCC